MYILLHSSKTMATQPSAFAAITPQFIAQARTLQQYAAQLPITDLQSAMHISAKLAATVHDGLQAWPTTAITPALFAFRGDIYSGLRAADFTDADVAFAQRHLRILSGLYGVLRPLDGIAPYRLEAGYRLPSPPYRDLYAFWATHVATAIPQGEPVIHVSSNEYAKLVLPFIDTKQIITPQFLTRPGPGKEPVFVVVHSKIARGAFARWLIKRGVDTVTGLEAFDDLGYLYAPDRSTTAQPTYICDTFGGIGLSQRVTNRQQ